MARSEAAAERVGRVLKERYWIERVLHIGSDNTVYAGVDSKAGRVAIKVLGGADASALRRSYLANAVGHPSAVNVLDTGTTDDGAPFLVMELLDAKNLDALLREHDGRLPVRLVCNLADQGLDLLACAHEQGIVHGELGRAALFWTRGGQLKVLGFGKQDPDGEGAAHAAGVAEDIRALSEVVARLLDGEACATQRELDATAPHGAGDRITAVIARGRAPRATERWQSARAMRAALQQACRADLGQPVGQTLRRLPPTASNVPRPARSVGMVALGALFFLWFLWRGPFDIVSDSPSPDTLGTPDALHTRDLAGDSALPSPTAPTQATQADHASRPAAPQPQPAPDATPAQGSTTESAEPARVIPRKPRLRELRVPVQTRRSMPTRIGPISRLCGQLSEIRRTRILTQDEEQLWAARCTVH